MVLDPSRHTDAGLGHMMADARPSPPAHQIVIRGVTFGRRPRIKAGAQIVQADFAASSSVIDVSVPPTKRAIAVQVDQVTGVGTVIKTGDYVDMVVGIPSERFPSTFSMASSGPSASGCSRWTSSPERRQATACSTAAA